MYRKFWNFGKNCSLHHLCWRVSLQPRTRSCLAVHEIHQLLQKPECSSCHCWSQLLDPILIQFNSHRFITAQFPKSILMAFPIILSDNCMSSPFKHSWLTYLNDSNTSHVYFWFIIFSFYCEPLLCKNIVLSILYAETFFICHTFIMADQFLHSHKT